KILTLEGHTARVNCVVFSPSGELLASCSGDIQQPGKPVLSGEVIVWNVRAGTQVHVLKTHAGGIFQVAWSADGALLASGSMDKTVKVWDAHAGREVYTLAGHRGLVNGVAFSRDGRLASASSDGTVKVWDIRN